MSVTVTVWAWFLLIGLATTQPATATTQPPTTSNDGWETVREAEAWYALQLSQLRGRHNAESGRLTTEFLRRVGLCLERAMGRRDVNAANEFNELKQHVALLGKSRYPHLKPVGPTGNLLSQMHARGIGFQPGREVRLSKDTLLESAEEYCSPLEVEYEVKLDRGDLRLFFARGCIILNWGSNPTELRIHDLAHCGVASAHGKGSIPVGEWIRCKILVDDESVRVFVNDVERVSHRGWYEQLPGRVAISTGHEGLVSVRRIEVRPLK